MNKKGQAIAIGIIVVLLVVLGFFVFKPGSNSNIASPTGETKTFDIVAKQWEFEPSEVMVNAGDKVILNVESVDVNHGISIPEFGVNEFLEPGKTVKVEFTADKKGSYSFFCNVFCGSGHGSMRGTLIVE